MAISTIGTNSLSDPIAVNATGALTGTVNGLTPQASNMQPFNRIINGAMTIDQRNAGAAVTPTGSGYTLDRWIFNVTQSSKFSVQQNAGAVTPPVGFSKYMGITSSSAYSVASGDIFVLAQVVEGYNIADLAWGTANAKTVTISFQVRSSLTGTFGGAVTSGAVARSYPFTYTINSANTWETKTVTIAGDTSSTWNTDNSGGLVLYFGFGVGSTYSGSAGSWSNSIFRSAAGAVSVVGTSGATFYITGVQLEAGSTASPFAHENYGDTLRKCQRYFQLIDYSTSNGGIAANWYQFTIPFLMAMRATPTMVASQILSNTGSAIATQDSGNVSGWTLADGYLNAALVRGPNFLLSRGITGRGQFNSEL